MLKTAAAGGSGRTGKDRTGRNMQKRSEMMGGERTQVRVMVRAEGKEAQKREQLIKKKISSL